MHNEKPQDPSVAVLARLERAHENLQTAVLQLDRAQQAAIEKKRNCNEPQFAERIRLVEVNFTGPQFAEGTKLMGVNFTGPKDPRKLAAITEINRELARCRVELAGAHAALNHDLQQVNRAKLDLERVLADRLAFAAVGTEENYLLSRRLVAHCLWLCAATVARQAAAWLSVNPLPMDCRTVLNSFYNSPAFPLDWSRGKPQLRQFQLAFIEALPGGERLEKAYKAVLEIRSRIAEALELVAKKQGAATTAFNQKQGRHSGSQRPASDPGVIAQIELARVLLAAFQLHFQMTAKRYEMKDAAYEVIKRIGGTESSRINPLFDGFKVNCIIACQLFDETDQEEERRQNNVLTWDGVNRDAVETMRRVLDVVEGSGTMDGFAPPDTELTRKIKSPVWRPDQPEFWLMPPVAASPKSESVPAEEGESGQ